MFFLSFAVAVHFRDDGHKQDCMKFACIKESIDRSAVAAAARKPSPLLQTQRKNLAVALGAATGGGGDDNNHSTDDETDDLEFATYPEAKLVTFAYNTAVVTAAIDDGNEGNNSSVLATAEVAHQLARRMMKQRDDEFRIHQLDLDLSLYETFIRCLNDEYASEKLLDEPMLLSQVICIERALIHRVNFAIRQKREVFELARRNRISPDEVDRAKQGALDELRTVVEFVGKWHTQKIYRYWNEAEKELGDADAGSDATDDEDDMSTGNNNYLGDSFEYLTVMDGGNDDSNKNLTEYCNAIVNHGCDGQSKMVVVEPVEDTIAANASEKCWLLCHIM